MKAACLLFLTMSCAMLMQGTSYAAPSQQTSAQSSANTAGVHPHGAEHAVSPDNGKRPKEGNPSDEQRGPRYASGKNHPRSRASLSAANRHKQLPRSRKSCLPKNAMKLHQSASDKSRGAATGGLIRNETVQNTLPVRPPSVVRAAVPSLDNVRHRGPNPAVIGGAANSDSRNTGAINGTRMNHKP
jgi:hypothetical protein